MSPGNISECCSGDRTQAGGYEFRQGEPNEPAVLPGEVWKPYESAKVSSLGRFEDSNGIVKTPIPAADGYVSVMINGKTHSIHILIAKAFDLPRRDDQNEVNHKDGNPSNNRLDNLRMGDSYATNEHRRSTAGPATRRRRVGVVSSGRRRRRRGVTVHVAVNLESDGRLRVPEGGGGGGGGVGGGGGGGGGGG